MAESLILIEHDRQQVKRPSLHAITLARQLGGEYALLVLGHGLDGIAASLVSYGASAVIVADDPALAEPLADRYATVIAEAARKRGAKTILGTSSTFSKDVLPRAAALLDAPMVTDVLAIEEMDGSISYRRPINAGSMFAMVKVEGDRRVLTVRATAFEAPAANAAPCPIERFDFDAAFASQRHTIYLPRRAQVRPARPDRSPRGRIWRQAAKGQGNIRASGRRIGGRVRRRNRRHPRCGRCRDGA